MNYPQKNTVTFLFRISSLAAFVLIQMGCFSSLSSSGGSCASDDDCLGAQTCINAQCAVNCFTTQDCPMNESCVFNRCEAAAEVYADMALPTPDSEGINIQDSTPTDTDQGVPDMTMVERDQSLTDMLPVSEDMALADSALPLDATSEVDSQISGEQPDAAQPDAS